MAAPDRTSRNAFRKGIYRKNSVHEDPTYLSFMFLFHQFDHPDVGHSPLFDGTAERYLTQVVRKDVGEAYAKNLRNFNRVLTKINREMPWFWQTLKGVELALNYGEMTEPWRGAEKPVLEIECLEENVELTAIGLMDLYKRACFDFERYVEVVPRNLREFSFDLYISEIRDFQKDTDARNLGITDNPDSRLREREVGQRAVELHAPWSSDTVGDSAEARPFIALRFTHCEFDINSIAEYFADLSRNPEAKRPTLKIRWGTCRQINQKLGPNMFQEDKAAPTKTDQQLRGPADPAQRVNEMSAKPPTNISRVNDALSNVNGVTPEQRAAERERVRLGDVIRENLGKVVDDVEDTAAGLVGQVENAVNSFSLQPNGLGNAHGNIIQGVAGSLLDTAVENATARLLLDNVHGAGGLGSIQDAINGGLINAIGNLVGSGGDNPTGGALSGGFGGGGGNVGERIHPDGVDSSPDGNIQERVYEPAVDSSPDGGLNQRIHEPGIDSSPDGNLNDNVHE